MMDYDFGFPYEILNTIDYDKAYFNVLYMEELLDSFFRAFTWSKTKEGYEYLNNVAERLERIEKSGH